MYNYNITPTLRNILKKLSKKDKGRYEQIINKIEEIINCADADHYKNLRRPLQHLKGVHINHFVLVFSVEKSSKTLTFENYDHHDNIYKNPY